LEPSIKRPANRETFAFHITMNGVHSNRAKNNYIERTKLKKDAD
jgi:hypothetical protein